MSNIVVMVSLNEGRSVTASLPRYDYFVCAVNP